MTYPDLSKENIICFDIETYDPELIEKGTGVYRKDGNILGVAIKSLPSGFKEYFNIGHKGIPQELKQKNMAYIKELMLNSVQKLGAGILYDLDWLQDMMGEQVNCRLHDIQVAEPLLDENKLHYNLDALASEYLGESKKSEPLKELCKAKGLKGDIRKHLWRFSYDLIRDYVIGDVELPLDIFRIQRGLLKEQDLWELYLLEMDLFPLLLQMRRQGARLNMPLVDKYTGELYLDMKKDMDETYSKYGKYNVNSGKQIAVILDKL